MAQQGSSLGSDDKELDEDAFDLSPEDDSGVWANDLAIDR